MEPATTMQAGSLRLTPNRAAGTAPCSTGRPRPAFTCAASGRPTADPQGSHHPRPPQWVSRRDALACIAVAAPLMQAGSARSSAAVFDDAADGFSLEVPEGWVSGSGENKGDGPGATTQRVVAWYPRDAASAAEANVSLVITNVGADFTRLGSFGTPYEFGTSLVGTMDRSYLLRGPAFLREKEGPVQTAKLLDAVAVGSTYQVDYTVNKPGEAPKRLRSLVAMGSNGRVNKLFTLTAQCSEDQYSKYEPAFKQVLDTFKAPSQN